MIRKATFLICFLIASSALFAQDVIIQSEFEKNEGLLLKWNYSQSIDSAVAQIASIISSNDKIWIIYDPANPYTTAQIQAELALRGANLTNIFFTEGTAENPWLRDYGPVAGYYTDNSGNNRHFVDALYNPAQYPQADFLPLQLASDFGFNYEAMPLNFEAGNLLLDGIGRGFIGDRILSENPALNTAQVIQTLYTKLSLNEIIILPSIPECGGGEWSELSRLMKFIDSETVLLSQFPESVPFYQQIESIADTLSKSYNDVGKPFEVIRLPVAPDETGGYAVSNSGIIRSYTSSIIFNNKVLIPSYDQPTDETALNIYRQVLPGYEIFQVPSQALASLHGSLYRLAVNIPQPSYFRLRHSKHTGMQPFESEVWINAFVESWNPVDSLMLFYRVHPSTTYMSDSTYGCCGGNSGILTGFTISDTISYYIRAYSGDYSQPLPLAAPEAVYTFWFDPYTGLKPATNEQTLTIFPNPASDLIFVKGIAQDDPEARYELIDMHGVIVDKGKIPGTSGIKVKDNLANGFYMFKVITSGKTQICKLYLQR